MARRISKPDYIALKRIELIFKKHFGQVEYEDGVSLEERFKVGPKWNKKKSISTSADGKSNYFPLCPPKYNLLPQSKFSSTPQSIKKRRPKGTKRSNKVPGQTAFLPIDEQGIE